MKGQFQRTPAALRRQGVALDNIALVPASLLPFKERWHAVAKTLPRGTVLLVLPRRKSTQRRLLTDLARRFAARGHPIATRTVEEVGHL